MGYFNYFIKCLIRNFAYQASKPKVWLTVLLAIIILFGLKHYGFCSEWSESDIDYVLNQLTSISNDMTTQVAYLISINADVGDISTDLDNIKTMINNIKTDTSNISTNVNSLLAKIDSVNTTLSQLYAQQNLYFEDFSEELRTIRDALVGSDDTPFTAEYLGIINATSSSGYTPGLREYKIPMIKNYTYKIQITYTNNESSAIGVYYMLSGFNVDTGGVVVDAGLVRLGNVPANSSAMFTITTRDYTKPYLYLTYGYNSISVSGTCSIEGIVDILDRTNQQVVDNIQQGNQLQQEQNQLQQEQNDFLKDDNVSADSSTLPTDTTEDITSDGFNNIFNQLYTTFTSGSAKDVVITIPFTNKSFIINSSTVYGGANLGFIKTLIEMFWYFVISYFIVQDVGNKINKIKSGDIEHVQDNNIKEDLL